MEKEMKMCQHSGQVSLLESWLACCCLIAVVLRFIGLLDNVIESFTVTELRQLGKIHRPATLESHAETVYTAVKPRKLSLGSHGFQDKRQAQALLRLS